jgi:hypothetical protein
MQGGSSDYKLVYNVDKSLEQNLSHTDHPNSNLHITPKLNNDNNSLSWSWALLEKLKIVQLLKNFPAFYGTRRFITAFTTALHWSLSWARSNPPHPSKIHFNIVHPPTSWSSWHSHQYPICIPLLPPSCYMPCSSHPPWLDHSNYPW